MKTTIEAMKQVKEFLLTLLQNSTDVTSISLEILALDEAIAREEAQIVEPIGYADQHGRLYDIKVIKALMMNTTEMIPVFTHQAPAKQPPKAITTAIMRDDGGEKPVYLVATGVVHEGQETYTRHNAQPPLCDAERLLTPKLGKQLISVNRDLLIKELRAIPYQWCSTVYINNRVIEAADMLAADAQHDAFNDAFSDGRQPWRQDAKQVVVPNGWKLVPINPTSEMCVSLRLFRSLTSEQTHRVYSAMLAAAPQPPQSSPEKEPHGWMIQGSNQVFKGEHAELDSKAEAKRCGGTCYAYPIYLNP